MTFEHSDSIKTILPKLIEVQKEMPQLSKDANNPHARSKYVTLDNILGNLNPLLNDRGIFLTQIPVEESSENTQKIGVETIFWHKDGEYVKYPAVLYSFEKGGKMNLTQSVGSIISYARRYALTSILALSTAEDDDGVQPNQPNNAPQNKPKPPKKITTTQVNTLKKIIVSISDLVGQTPEQATKIVLNASKVGAGSLEDINEQQYGSFLNYLNAMRTSYEDKVKGGQPEQTSLMDGNTTKAKGSD